MIKHFLISLSLVLFSSIAYSTHILGGTVNYKYVSSTANNTTYSLTLEIYRDCFNGIPASFKSDSIIKIGIYDKGKKQLVAIELFTKNGLKHFSGCLSTSEICIDIALYQKNIVLPKNDSGYIALYSRCCFGSQINNVYSPEKTGMGLFTFIPPVNVINNSALFYFIPQFINEIGKNSFDFGAYDLDGDSLVYSLVAPYSGGSQSFPIPEPDGSFETPKPFIFRSGYSYSNPMGSSGGITLDPKTGKITFKNSLEGMYLLSTELKEYRKGQLIGITRRLYPYFFMTSPTGKTTSPLLYKPILNNLNVSLSWEMCNINVSKYLLERKIGSGPWSLINASAINEPYIDTISRDIKYTYRVRAIVKTDTFYSNYESVFTTKAKINSVISNTIKIHPNPFSDEINIELTGQTFPVECNIYNYLGVMVKSVLISSNNFKILTSDIPKGLYTLEIKTIEGDRRVKLILK